MSTNSPCPVTNAKNLTVTTILPRVPNTINKYYRSDSYTTLGDDLYHYVLVLYIDIGIEFDTIPMNKKNNTHDFDI